MTAITWLKHNWCKVLVVVILSIILPAVIVVLFSVAIACSTYECYSQINSIPVIICCMGMPLISFVVGIILFMCYIYMVNNGREKQFRNNISTVIKLVFGNFLKKPDSKEEEEKFIVLGYEASLKEMYGLIFILLVEATLLAFAQFWDDFLLEVSGSCGTDSLLHCFYTTDSILTYQELNCLNTSQVEEATSIICYKYAFNTGRAAASAIGIISATGLIIYIICIVFLKVLDGPRLSIWPIILVKLVAIVEVTIFCGALGALQAIYTPHALGNFGIANSFQKVLGMGVMITTSVIVFPIAKFRKSENRDEYEPINNEPQHETA